VTGVAGHQLLLTSPGGVLRNNLRWRVFDSAALSIGLAGPTPHELPTHRSQPRCCGGANVQGGSAMLGHESATITLDVYADLFETEPADS
jgi:hypothetical protein